MIPTGRSYVENVSGETLTVRVDDDLFTLRPGAVASWPENHSMSKWLRDSVDAFSADARLSLTFDPVVVEGGFYMPNRPTTAGFFAVLIEA